MAEKKTQKRTRIVLDSCVWKDIWWDVFDDETFEDRLLHVMTENTDGIVTFFQNRYSHGSHNHVSHNSHGSHSHGSHSHVSHSHVSHSHEYYRHDNLEIIDLYDILPYAKKCTLFKLFNIKWISSKDEDDMNEFWMDLDTESNPTDIPVTFLDTETWKDVHEKMRLCHIIIKRNGIEKCIFSPFFDIEWLLVRWTTAFSHVDAQYGLLIPGYPKTLLNEYVPPFEIRRLYREFETRREYHTYESSFDLQHLTLFFQPLEWLVYSRTGYALLTCIYHIRQHCGHMSIDSSSSDDIKETCFEELHELEKQVEYEFRPYVLEQNHACILHGISGKIEFIPELLMYIYFSLHGIFFSKPYWTLHEHRLKKMLWCQKIWKDENSALSFWNFMTDGQTQIHETFMKRCTLHVSSLTCLTRKRLYGWKSIMDVFFQKWKTMIESTMIKSRDGKVTMYLEWIFPQSPSGHLCLTHDFPQVLHTYVSMASTSMYRKNMTNWDPISVRFDDHPLYPSTVHILSLLRSTSVQKIGQ